MEPSELAVQLLDLGHQVMVEPSYFDSCLTQPKLTSPTDVIVRVEHTDTTRLIRRSMMRSTHGTFGLFRAVHGSMS